MVSKWWLPSTISEMHLKLKRHWSWNCLYLDQYHVFIYLFFLQFKTLELMNKKVLMFVPDNEWQVKFYFLKHDDFDVGKPGNFLTHSRPVEVVMQRERRQFLSNTEEEDAASRHSYIVQSACYVYHAEGQGLPSRQEDGGRRTELRATPTLIQ